VFIALHRKNLWPEKLIRNLEVFDDKFKGSRSRSSYFAISARHTPAADTIDRLVADRKAAADIKAAAVNAAADETNYELGVGPRAPSRGGQSR
jgi:hypothetical protein